MSEPVPRLDSRKLSCLQRMGITVWQRRSASNAVLCDEVAAVVDVVKPPQQTPPAAASADAAPRVAPALSPATPADLPAAPAVTPPLVVEAVAQASRSEVLLQMQIEAAAADAAIKRATAVIARASLPGKAATPLLADEYQLLRKMMESIDIQAGQWIAVSEVNRANSAADSQAAASLAELLTSSSADVLLLLMPASELSHSADYWADLEQNLAVPKGRQAQPLCATQMIAVGERTVAIAPLCDPQDLLHNGALKRDAWECLKAVRTYLSRAPGAVPLG